MEPTSLKLCGLEPPSMYDSPRLGGLTRQFCCRSYLDALTGLQSDDSAIISSRAQSSLYGGSSGPREQSQKLQDLWNPGSETSSASLLPHPSVKAKPMTNTIIFSGEEFGGKNRLYMSMKGASKYFGFKPGLQTRLSKRNMYLTWRTSTHPPTGTHKKSGVADIGKYFFSTLGI